MLFNDYFAPALIEMLFAAINGTERRSAISQGLRRSAIDTESELVEVLLYEEIRRLYSSGR